MAWRDSPTDILAYAVSFWSTHEKLALTHEQHCLSRGVDLPSDSVPDGIAFFCAQTCD